MALNAVMALLLIAAGLALSGWSVLSLIGPKSLAWALAVPAALGLGLAVISIAAWIAWLTGTGMTGAVVVAAALTAGAAAASVVLRRLATPAPPTRLELCSGVLIGASVACAVYSGPWLGQSADSFYHMAAALALLRENRAVPQDVFFNVIVPYPDTTTGAVNLVLAWASAPFGIVPAWFATTLFGAAFATACFVALANEITRSTAAATIAGGLYLALGLGLDMRAAGYPNRIAPGLVWLAFAFVIRFAREGTGRWRDLAAACLLALAGVSVYSGAGPLAVTVASGLLAAAVVVAAVRRSRRGFTRSGIACAAVVAAVAPVLGLRILATFAPAGPEASLASIAPRLDVLDLGGYLFVDPRFWFTGFVSFATVGTFCLLGRARRMLAAGDPGAALLWGCLLLVPAISVTPVLARFPDLTYFALRIALLVAPLLFIPLGWELSELRWLPARILRRAPRPSSNLSLVAGYALAAATLLMLAEQVPSAVLVRYLGHSPASINASRAGNLSVLWADRVRALAAAGPGAVLAGLETSYELAGLTGRRVVAVPGGHTPYGDDARDGALRRGDVADALRPAADLTALVSVLTRYDVTFVLIDRALDGDATWTWIAGQRVLTPVASGDGWALYRYDPRRVDSALDIALHDGAGLYPSHVITGRAVFVRFVSSGSPATVKATGTTTGAVFSTITSGAAPSGSTVTVPLLIPDSARVDAYDVSVVAGASTSAGEVVVGRAYEAEFFKGVVVDPQRGFARNAGWEVVSDAAFSRGMAARALRDGAVSNHPLDDPAGDYCLVVSVSTSGAPATYRLALGLGGEETDVTWSAPTPGVQEVRLDAHVGSASDQLSYWIPTGDTPHAVVDSITLYPAVMPNTCSAPG